MNAAQAVHGRGGASSRVTSGGYDTGGTRSSQVHIDQLPAHLKLKTRRGEQAASKSRAELLAELEAREAPSSHRIEDETNAEALLQGEAPLPVANQGLLTAGLTSIEASILEPYLEVDRDADVDGGGGDEQGEAGESSDDEDEEEALRRELEKIRKERQEEKLAREKEEEELARAEAAAGAATSNPLLAESLGGGSSSVPRSAIRRRWDEDVVFRNQATGPLSGSSASKKSYINDPLRNEFHRKFMKKYIY